MGASFWLSWLGLLDARVVTQYIPAQLKVPCAPWTHMQRAAALGAEASFAHRATAARRQHEQQFDRVRVMIMRC